MDNLREVCGNIKGYLKEKIKAGIQAFPRDVRRFILNPKRDDIVYFVVALFVVGFGLTLVTSLLISSHYNVPRHLFFKADGNFCTALVEKENYDGIKCKIDISTDNETQISKLDLLDDKDSAIGAIEFLMSYGFALKVYGIDESLPTPDKSVPIADKFLIDRTPLLWNSGLYSTQVLATVDNYQSIIQASLKQLNKFSEAGWSDSAMEKFAANTVKKFLLPFIKNAQAVDKSSPYTSTMPLLIYFSGWVGLLGYLAMGSGSLYVQHRFGTKVPNSMEERLKLFDDVIDSLPAIGLLGTVIGMIFAMNAFGKQDDENAIVAKLSQLQLNTGISLALYTTLLGSSINLFIRIFICHPFNLFAFHRQTKILGVVSLSSPMFGGRTTQTQQNVVGRDDTDVKSQYTEIQQSEEDS